MIETRLMQESDLAAGDRLVRFAGWNQVENDWRIWLKLPRARVWVTETNGRVVASAAAIPYQRRFGWLGMVLVDPDFRRRGLAGELVRQALNHLEQEGCRCQKLDATAEGHGLYEKFGFRPEYEVRRWRRSARELDSGAARPDVVSLEPTLLGSLEDLDRPAFGASRQELLRSLLAAGKGICLQPRPGVKGVQGYALVRPGRAAAQLGPLVASSPRAAKKLMETLVRRCGGADMIADAATVSPAAEELLGRMGFSPVRRLIRMFRGPNQFRGRTEDVYCLAGFEWG